MKTNSRKERSVAIKEFCVKENIYTEKSQSGSISLLPPPPLYDLYKETCMLLTIALINQMETSGY